MMAPTITDFDQYLWNEGSHSRAYEKMGAHLGERDGILGTHFAVWAPNAERISVIGDFNNWQRGVHWLSPSGSSGIWQGFLPGVRQGALYKYAIESRYGGYRVDKADPFGFAAEIRPSTASKVWDLAGYDWQDREWMASRGGRHQLGSPISVYEVHLGSWRRAEDNRWLSYREIAPLLADYVHDMGFTHVELLPITEHPFDGSWGYQTVGYFAPTSRFCTPPDFMSFIDTLHQRGIGVILDWVPAHFPRDEHGIGYFDGTHLYEHADARQGVHQDWGTFIYNFGRPEVVSFLLSSALFWLDKYHIDGLRVDAVASMLYLDYSREPGHWTPNKHGGRENLEAIEFLKRFNRDVYSQFPDTITIAEESTAWPAVSRPTYVGGLGFGYKWDMGWMHDTLKYFASDPVHRKYHHGSLCFRAVYAFSENFMLPLSHDEVVHGNGSLIMKMPGDDWQRFAGLRLLLGYMFTQPGKKLLFMGNEIGQWREWDHDAQLDWGLLQQPVHAGLARWVRDLNTLYRGETALHDLDCDAGGFRWIDCNDAENSVLSFLRQGRQAEDQVVVVCNLTPVPRHNYQIGVPRGGKWQEVLNSDAPLYGGSGQGNFGGVTTAPIMKFGNPYMLTITVPPLGMVAFRHEFGP